MLNNRKPQRTNGEIVPDVDVAYFPAAQNMKVPGIPSEPWSWGHAFFAPFDYGNPKNPGLLSAILVGLQIFLFTFLAGIILNLAAEKICTELNAPLAGPATGAALLAFLQFAVFYAFGWFTREKYLPTYILPEFYLSMIITRKIGVFVAFAGAALGFLGYTVAAFAAIAANGHRTSVHVLAGNYIPTNVPSSTSSYWLFWLGGTLINFAWLWCTQIRNDKDEDDTSMYQRGIATVSALMFVFVLAFFGLSTAGGNGLIYFSPGLYTTSIIFAPNMRTFDTSTNPILIFLLIGILVVPPTASLLFLLLSWVVSYRLPSKSVVVKIVNNNPGQQDNDNNDMSNARVSKNIFVNY
jgi:hypothetical protein